MNPRVASQPIEDIRAFVEGYDQQRAVLVKSLEDTEKKALESFKRAVKIHNERELRVATALGDNEFAQENSGRKMQCQFWCSQCQ